MKAGILTIGDELVNGFSVDTNSVWLAQELLKRGITVVAKASVGDDLQAIRDALARWDGQLELVITTGGLGPTHDDVTKTAFCQYFESDLRFDETYWDVLVERFRKRGIEIPLNNRAQAEIPQQAEALPNSVGTAPGLKFQSGTTTYYVLPGVPREMKAIAGDHLLPRLKAARSLSWVTIRTTGIMESALSIKIEPLVSSFKNIQVAYLPSYTGVDIRLQSTSADSLNNETVESSAVEIETLLGDFAYGRDDAALEQIVGQLLTARGETLAVAESCSGGLVASRIVDIPGSSAYMLGAIVAYSNESKALFLNVSEETLIKDGAVSEATAREMAEGVRSVFNADWGVATTGISGPTGGTSEKPVGLVYLAVAGPQRTITKEARLVPFRLPHKAATAQAALNLLRLEIMNHG